MSKKKKRLVYRTSILGLLALMVVFAVYQGIEDDTKTALNTQGEIAPNFTGITSKDDKLVLKNELEGKTLINFWGSWCEPCKREMPALETAHSQYSDRGFKVISVNLGQSDFVTDQFIKQYNLTFPVLIDQDGSIKNAYHVGKLPVSFLVDADGVIQKVHEGELTETMLNNWIDES